MSRLNISDIQEVICYPRDGGEPVKIPTGGPHALIEQGVLVTFDGLVGQMIPLDQFERVEFKALNGITW